MEIRELENQVKNNDNQYNKKVSELKDQQNKDIIRLREDGEQMLKNQKNLVKSLQIELDMERNQMSAQEEMLHSLVHNITLEFSAFSEKNGGQAKKKKKTKGEESFLDKRMNQVYQNN